MRPNRLPDGGERVKGGEESVLALVNVTVCVKGEGVRRVEEEEEGSAGCSRL